MTIDTEIMREYVSKRLPKMSCAACGDATWNVPESHSLRILLEVSDADHITEFRPVHPYLPVLWVSCASCGHIRLFSRAAVQSWWRETVEQKSRAEGWSED